MGLAFVLTVVAGLAHAYGLSEESAGAAGIAFALGFLSIVQAIASLPAHQERTAVERRRPG